MISIVSPAKSLDYSPISLPIETSMPRFPKQTLALVKQLKKLKSPDIQKLMGVSEKIADLNVQRFKTFSETYDESNSKAAAYAFNGDVYQGLEAETMSEKNILFAQDHIRILSGLYGLLRPLDLMQAYRLEMGTKFQNKKGKNLYEFWSDQIVDLINEDLSKTDSNVLVNLASKEYFKAVNTKKLKGTLVHVHFKEYRGDKLKIISFSAKRARGTMARYIIDHELQDLDALKGFNRDNYSFSEELSTDTDFLFVR